MDVDVRIAAAAAAQHGLFTTADALAAGADSALITRRVQVGRWLRVARGLYSLPSMPDPWERSVPAAALRLAPPSASSHRPSAHFRGLFGRPKRFEVIAGATGNRKLRFIA